MQSVHCVQKFQYRYICSMNSIHCLKVCSMCYECKVWKFHTALQCVYCVPSVPCVVLTLCSMLCPPSMQCHRVIKLPLSHQHSEPASQNHSVHFCKLWNILHHIIYVFTLLHCQSMCSQCIAVHCNWQPFDSSSSYLRSITSARA